jgi:hypothetical protein
MTSLGVQALYQMVKINFRTIEQLDNTSCQGREVIKNIFIYNQ